MIYSFSNYKLDTDKHELSMASSVIVLTRQNYDLLLLFVENPNKVFSKDELIEKIWQGRFVTDNSIDQSISKLRKALEGIKSSKPIKTVYGKGYMFTAEVSQADCDEQTPESSNKHFFAWALAVLMITAIGVFLWFNNRVEINPPPVKSILLIVTPDYNGDEDNWLARASVNYLDQVLGYSPQVTLKDIKQKPKHQNKKQYINTQWEISPELKVVTTEVIKNKDIYTIKLTSEDGLGNQLKKSFTDKDIVVLMNKANLWMLQNANASPLGNKLNHLLPSDPYVLELYLRGLASYDKGEFNKAEHFYQLCIDEKPDFYLARLELARVKNLQGKPEQGLAILDTLSQLPVFPQIEIDIANIRGAIYNIQGKDEINKDMYLSLLKKYADQDIPQLLSIKLNLVFTYAKLTEYDAALALLKALETQVDTSIYPEFLANILQKKSSILQKLGHTQLAQVAAEKSLQLFSKLHDLLGEAKTHSTLARITTHQGNYKASIEHLNRSLAICQELDYSLGIGASLNELIYVYMVQGEFTKAWQANQQMQAIAIEIDYSTMLQISKQFSADITRSQGKWQEAKIYLKEYLELAQASNNKRALFKYNLLKLDWLLDQEKAEDVLALIAEVQEHIDVTKQIRLQPRIDKQLSRYYFLTQQSEKALALLLASKQQAKQTEDGETLVEINNLLAEHYLQSNQAQKALAVLEESVEYKPLPYPYLLLKSKANLRLGNKLTALDLANECKSTANEWWTLEDNRYLIKLKKAQS